MSGDALLATWARPARTRAALAVVLRWAPLAVVASVAATGSQPVARPSAITIGTTIVALATLLVNSLVITATRAAATTSTVPAQSPSGIHDVIEPLMAWCFFWPWDMSRDQVRWMTAWDTTEEDVERFVAGVRAALDA